MADKGLISDTADHDTMPSRVEPVPGLETLTVPHVLPETSKRLLCYPT